MKTILIILCVLLGIFVLYKAIQNIERILCTFVFHQIIFAASPEPVRQAVIHEIRNNYPWAKNVVEIGAGYGGFARKIAKNTDTTVYAVENMPFSFAVLKISNFITSTHNCRAVFADAFKYIYNMRRRADIGVAYLGPGMNDKLVSATKKFRVLITLDAPITKMRPTRIVDLSKYGCTIWHGIKLPHKLFIYEM